MRYTNEAKNCNLDLSVEWFQLLFRKIKTNMQCIIDEVTSVSWVVKALAWFSDRHVTRFRLIACTDFEMRYNKLSWCTLLWSCTRNTPWSEFTDQ